VDENGVQPTSIGELPLQLAALNRTNVNVQTLAVQAALTGNRENVFHAVALDPLTAALLTLEQIRAMTEELLTAHAERLPEALRA
jgi:alpha-galactosidase